MRQDINASSTEFTGDFILNELYINPRLYEVEQFLRAEETGEVRVSFAGIANSVHKTIPRTLFRSFHRAEVTSAMACSNISFSAAQDIYPHLFDYV